MYDYARETGPFTRHSDSISDMVGNGYRPQCLVAGFMDAENQHYLATDEGIHVCQGQIWSQHGIDNGDGDGGICYPYYPSREHYLKPAQGPADFIDCVCLDGWTCDFLPLAATAFREDSTAVWGSAPSRRSRISEKSRPRGDDRHHGYALRPGPHSQRIWLGHGDLGGIDRP